MEGADQISKYMFSFAESMALKCAVDLRIADIIHSHGHPITLTQIASGIEKNHSQSPEINNLNRVIRMLVRKKIFVSVTLPNSKETLYDLTPSSKYLLHDAELSLVPMFLLQNHLTMLKPWHYLSKCVTEGGSGFKKAHGFEAFELASIDPRFNEMFNDAMECVTRIVSENFVKVYDLSCVGSAVVVDVGGGKGRLVCEIVKANFPHVKGVNFDLPHVVANAPVYDGVLHVAGDMFDSIPSADAILLKNVLHDWGDEDCIKILQNCRKAISNKSGKIIIIEMVVNEESDELFGDMDLVFDLLMMAHSIGGKERTRVEWKDVLEAGGFSRFNIIKLPIAHSLIEAYPN